MLASTRLNPLDPGPKPKGLGAGEWAQAVTTRRRQLLAAVAETTLGRGLYPAERTALDVALEFAGVGTDQVCLPAVVEALTTPSKELANRERTTIGDLAAAGADVHHGLRRLIRGDLAGRTVAVWGAAFKPGTSSVSNSVVHPLLQALWAQGCHTRVYDPLAMDALKKVYPAQPLLEHAGSVAASVVAADAIAVVTAWDEFWSPDFAAMAAQMRTAVVFDGRNLYEPEQMQACGFRYFGIGHGESI